MNTITYTIPAISCMHCVHTIKSELAEMEGVGRVEVDLDTKKVEIEYSAPATPEKIEGLLTEINYPPKK